MQPAVLDTDVASLLHQRKLTGPLATRLIGREQLITFVTFGERRPAFAVALAAAARRANADPGVHVIVLQGAGRAFCSGHDLKLSAEDGQGAQADGQGAQADGQGAQADAVWDPIRDYAMMKQFTDPVRRRPRLPRNLANAVRFGRAELRPSRVGTQLAREACERRGTASVR